MGANLNKKILCFIDEYGTAGTSQDLYLGAVIVLARNAGRIDKRLSDCLPSNVNELHAVEQDDGYLQSIMQRFWMADFHKDVVLINQRIASRGGTAPIIYAHAVVETVKIGLKRFQTDVLRRSSIGNVEVIMDANHHNGDPLFLAEIERAQKEDGRFKGVKHVMRLDSAASRLLQLADVVAYSRKWLVAGDFNAQALRERFGIQTP